MEFEPQLLSLARIRQDDSTYRITTGQSADRLVASIAAVGLINPPILQSQGEQFVVVSGFGRVAACRALGWAQLWVRSVPSQAAFLDCARLAIADNAAHRALNLVEMARALGLLIKAGANNAVLMDEFLALGVPVNTELGKKLMAVNAMSPQVQQGLIDGSIALPTALRLHAIPDPEVVNGFCVLFKELALGLNRQREILDWCQAIAMREAISLGEVLGAANIAAWLHDSQMDRGRKAKLIRDYLKRRRYPVITQFEEQYQRAVKALDLGEGIRLEPPLNFEGQTFGLHLSFDTPQAFAHLYARVAQLIEDPSFAALLTPIKPT